MKTTKRVIAGFSILLFLAATAGFGQIVRETSLTCPRNGHTATWVPGLHQILITGGEYSSTVWQTFELHSYAEGITYAGQMVSARAFHAACLLPDGSVLITGGKDSRGNSLNSAEIFAPGSRSFSPTSPMMRPRSGHTATALADGRILIVGGNAEGTVEWFDPARRTFSLGMALEVPRRLHSAILLDGGQVLIVGGTDMNGTPLLSAEIVDLSAPAPISALNDLSEARIRPDLRLLPDGKVQVIGGNEHETFEMYDPEGRRFKATVHVLPPGLDAREILWSGTRAALFHNHHTPTVDPTFDRLLDRSGHRLTEIDWPIPLAFVSGGLDSLGQALNSAFWLQNHSAVVTANLTDYVMGEPVIMSGRGWAAGEQVAIDISGVPSGESFHCLAVADASGDFTNSDFLTGEPGSAYLLTARSTSRGFMAQTSFQVSPSLISVGILPDVLTFPGGVAAYPFDIYRWDALDESFDLALTVLGPPDGPPLPPDTGFTFDPPVVHFEPGLPSAGAILTLHTSPSTPPDEYFFSIKAYRIDDPGVHATGAGRLIVEPQFPPLTIILPPESATRTVGDSVTFSVVAEGPEPLTFQWHKRESGPIAGATGDSYIIPAVTVLDAGQYYVKVSSPDDFADSAMAVLTVNKAIPEIIWPCPRQIRSGIALDASVLTAEAWFMGMSVPGTFEYEPPAGTIILPGPFDAVATFTPDDQHNYESCSAVAPIEAWPVPPQVNWPRPADISYGTPLSPAQLNATAAFEGQAVEGDFQYVPAAGEVLNAGADQTLTVFFNPRYPDAFLPVSGTTPITVHKVEPVITWSDPADIHYGTPLGDTQLSATASVPGTFAYDPAAGTVLLPGSRQLSVTFTPTDTVNYLVVAGRATINVTQATVTLTWDNPAEIVYGTPLGNAQLNAAADVPGTFAYSPAAGTVLDAGLGRTLHVDFTPEDAQTYPGASKDVTINVNPALLSIKAADASKPYGAALPEFTAGYTGFVPGQGPDVLEGSLVLSTTAEAGSPVGTYPITASGQTSLNYSIAYEQGTLSVSRAPLTVKADDAWMVLAGPLPAFNAAFDGFVLNEGPGLLGGTLVFNTPATPASPVGIYPVTPSGLASTNYEIVWLEGTLRVGYADAGACAGGHVILPPIKADGTSVFKRGSSVPAKFRVFDANCASVGTPGVVSAFRLVQIIAGTAADVDQEVYSTTPDTAFRWSAEEQLWIFNISTKGLLANRTYAYRITLNDGTEIPFQFGLK